MCFLPLKFSHYPSWPVPVPKLFGKYPTRPVPKSKTPTRRTLILGGSLFHLIFCKSEGVLSKHRQGFLQSSSTDTILILIDQEVRSISHFWTWLLTNFFSGKVKHFFQVWWWREPTGIINNQWLILALNSDKLIWIKILNPMPISSAHQFRNFSFFCLLILPFFYFADLFLLSTLF